MRRTTSLLLLILLVSLNISAQTIVLSESFEKGLPAGWTQETVIGNELWISESSSAADSLNDPSGAVAGNSRLALRNTSGESQGYKTRLITPVMRLDTVYQPILRYYHAQPKWTADFDTLRVYFRTSPNAEWIPLQEFAKSIQTWTKELLDLPRPSANYQLCFEGSENMGRGIVLDSILVRSKPECTTPHDLSVANMKPNAVTLYWQASFDAEQFQIVLAKSDKTFDIDTVNLAQAKADGLVVKDTLVNSLPFYVQLNNLQSKTNYVAFVRSICEVENSEWGVLQFYMKAIKSVPYYESFNMPLNSTPGHLTDWTYGNSMINESPFVNRHISSTAAKNYVREGTSLCFTGTNTLGSNSNISASDWAYAVTPEIDVPSLHGYQLRFWASLGEYGCLNTLARSIVIGVMTDPEDINSFEAVDTLTLWRYATYEEHYTSFENYHGTGKNIAFLSRFSQPNQFYIDDMTIEAIPAIGQVRDIEVAPTVTGVDLSWKDLGAAKYVVLVTDSMADNHIVDAIPATHRIAIEETTSTQHSIATGLQEGSDYYVYIKADGGEWSNAVAFTTSYKDALPMKFGFEDTEKRNGKYTWQWYSTTNKTYTINTNYRNSGSKALAFSKETGREAWLVFPMTDTIVQGTEIEFYLRAYSTSYSNTQITVGVMTNPADLETFVPVATFAPVILDKYQSFYSHFLSYTGNGRYIALRWTEKTGSGACYPIIDDVTIRPLANCIMPTLTLNSVTETTATFSWEARGMEQFSIMIDSINTRDNAALSTAFSTQSVVYTTTANGTNTLAVPEGVLRWGRTYYAYVRSDYEGESSKWSKPLMFTLNTPAAIALPYTEPFDYWGTGASAMAAAWEVVSTNSYPQVSTSAKYKGYAGVQLQCGTEGRAGKLYAPVLDIDDLRKLKLSFWAKKGDSVTNADSLFIGTAPDTDLASTITWLKEVTIAKIGTTAEWIKYELVLSNWTPALGNRIVFCGIQNATTRYIYMDEITFETLQNATPFNFSTIQTTSDEAQITWEGEADNGWNIIVTTEDINPADISNIADNKIIISDSVITERPFTITGLSPQTAYYVYLNPVGTQQWSEGYYVFTACKKLSTSTYFKMDFEGYLPVSNTEISSYTKSTFPECWTRIGGSTTSTDYTPFIVQLKQGTVLGKDSKAHQGLASAQLYSNSTAYPAWFTTPEIDAKNMANVTVSLWAYGNESQRGELLIGVMKDPEDYSTLTVLYTHSSYKMWEQVECNLGTFGYKPEMGNYIAFSSSPTGKATKYYIDEIEITESSCHKPNPVLSRLSHNSVVMMYSTTPMTAHILLSKAPMTVANLNGEGNEAYLQEILSSSALVKDTIVEQGLGLLLEGLEGDNDYYIVAQTLCDEETSSQWVGTSFHTLCSPQPITDFQIDFEDITGLTAANSDSHSIPCWIVGNKGLPYNNLYIPYVGTADKTAMNGKNFLALRTDVSNSTQGNGAYAIMPTMDIEDITKMQITFKGRALNSYRFDELPASKDKATDVTAAGGVIVGIVTDPTDMSTFVGVDTIRKTNNWMYDCIVRFNEYKGDADGKKGKNIAFLAEFDKTNFFLVDDIAVMPIPDCATPLSLKTKNIAAESATLSWKGLNDRYRVMITTKSIQENKWENNTGDIVRNDTIDTPSYTINGLTGATTYYAYVKALCDDDNGEWCLEELVFTTDCPETLALPYKETFDNSVSASSKNPPSCWRTFYNGLENTDASYPSVFSSAKYGDTGNGLYWYCTSTYAAEEKRPTAVTLPITGNIGETSVSFKLRTDKSATRPSAILVGVASDVSTLDNLLATVQYVDTVYPTVSSTAWTEYTRIMDDCTGENMHIVLSELYVYTTGNILYMDDFKVEKTPTCYAPDEVVVDSIGTHEVRLLLTPHFPTDQRWDIQLTCRFTDENGNEQEDIVETSVTESHCLISGLRHSTAYSLQVRTDCGSGDVSTWLEEPIEFTTLYEIGDGAFYGFEEEEGWVRIPGPTSAYYAHPSLHINLPVSTYSPRQVTNTASATYARSGKSAMLLEIYNNYGINAYFALPEIVGADTLQVRFDMRATSLQANKQVTDASVYQFAPVEVGTINQYYDLESYEPLAIYYTSMHEPNNKAPFNTVKESNNLLFDQVVIPLPADMSDKYLVFMNNTPVKNTVYIDNLHIEKKQGYQTPVIGKSAITPTSLTLEWDANGATAWNVYLANTPEAFPLDSAAPSAIVAQQLGVTATTVTFSGLTPATKYYAFLQVADAEGLGATSARRIYLTPEETKIATDSVLTFEGTHTRKTDIDLVGRYTGISNADTIYALPLGWYAGNDISCTRLHIPWARLNDYNATGTGKSAGVKVAYRGSRALQLYTPYASRLGAYAAMPEIEADYDTLQVNFYARPFHQANTNKVGVANGLKTPLVVGTMSDPNNPATFEVLDTLYYNNDEGLTTSTDAAALPNAGWQQFGFRLKGAKGKHVAFSAPSSSQWYIDDISFSQYTCLTPNPIVVTELTAHTAMLLWKPKDEGAECIVQVSSDSRFNEEDIILTDTLTGTSLQITGLNGTTNYWCRVRQICSTTDMSAWSAFTSFFTECAAVAEGYSNNFEDESDFIRVPENTTKDQPRCWIVGTTGSSGISKPYLEENGTTYGYAHSGKFAWYISASTSASSHDDDWVAMPAWDEEQDPTELQLTFHILPAQYNISTGKVYTAYTGTTYLPSLIIGVMSDPADLSTFVPFDTCTYTENLTANVTPANAANEYMYQRFSVPLEKIKDMDGQYLAFRTYTADYLAIHPEAPANMWTRIYLDDVCIEPLNKCPQPTLLTASDITVNSATLSWSGDEGATWIVNIYKDIDQAILLQSDTVNQMSVVINELDTFRTYYWRVAQVCSNNSVSPYSNIATFHTLRVPAYTEYFIQSIPEDWTKSQMSAQKVFEEGAALTPYIGYSSIWTQTNNANEYGLEGPHVTTRMNSSFEDKPTSVQVARYDWFVSPAIVLDKDKAAWLTFDAALTYYNTGDAAKTNGWDDQFMVVISDDEGATWKRENATIWNNETGNDPQSAQYRWGKGDYVLNDLPTKVTATTEPLYIDLAQYKGKTIKIGFYVESTVKNAYNELHLGNVRVNYYQSIEERRTACQFEDIETTNFVINGDEAAAGETIFTQVHFAATHDRLAQDTLYRLVATYYEAPQVIIDNTICEGETAGAEYGFVPRTTSGVYKRKNVSAVTGCDSITVLNLTVLPRLRSAEEVAICSGTAYEFNGITYNKTGVYVDTIQSVVTGCDSITTLVLTVTDAFEYEYDAYTCSGEPYYFTAKYPALLHSGKYIDSVKTAEGCDSIVTLNLTVYSDTMRVDTLIHSADLPYFYPNTLITYPLGTEPGVYMDTVTMKGQEGACDYVLVHKLTIEGGTGLGQLSYGTITLVPNIINVGESVMAKGNFGKERLTLEIYDVVGRRIKHEQVSGKAISITGFDVSGIYTVCLSDQQGARLFVGRVIVK